MTERRRTRAKETSRGSEPDTGENRWAGPRVRLIPFLFDGCGAAD